MKVEGIACMCFYSLLSLPQLPVQRLEHSGSSTNDVLIGSLLGAIISLVSVRRQGRESELDPGLALKGLTVQ